MYDNVIVGEEPDVDEIKGPDLPTSDSGEDSDKDKTDNPDVEDVLHLAHRCVLNLYSYKYILFKTIFLKYWLFDTDTTLLVPMGRHTDNTHNNKYNNNLSYYICSLNLTTAMETNVTSCNKAPYGFLYLKLNLKSKFLSTSYWNTIH